jgi:hypothetical protein
MFTSIPEKRECMACTGTTAKRGVSWLAQGELREWKDFTIEPRCEGRQESECPVRLRPRDNPPGRPKKRVIE